MPVYALEPWNPFDTSDKKCFPDISEALVSGRTTDVQGGSTVVDIDVLARHHAANINEFQPPDLGYLSVEVQRILEDKCQAWFDEQSRIKAVRGDSPTPSCSFRLPGIPFKDQDAAHTAKQGPTTSLPQAAPAHASAPLAQRAITPVDAAPAYDRTQMQPALHAAAQSSRESFAFAAVTGNSASQSSKRQYGVTARMSAAPSPLQTQSPSQQDAHYCTQHLQIPAVELTCASSQALQLATGEAVHAVAGPAAATAAPASSRLSGLMKQNLMQLQQLLEPERASPTKHEHTDQTDERLQLLQQNLEQQAFQQRVSLLLHTNKQQLQQLLESHQQQQQQQHASKQELQPDQLQEQQPESDRQLPLLLQRMQQQLSRLQLLTQQPLQQQEQPASGPNSLSQRCSRLQQPTQHAATASTTAMPAQQKAASSASPACSTVAQLQPTGQNQVAVQAAVPVQPVCGSHVDGAKHTPWQPATPGCSPAAAQVRQVSPSAVVCNPVLHRSRSTTTCSDAPYVHRFHRGSYDCFTRASHQVKAAVQQVVAAAGRQRVGSSIERCSRGPVHAWRGLQALQQQRWQQRLQADKAVGSFPVPYYAVQPSPTKDEAVQTDLPQDQSVQTHEGQSVPPSVASTGSTVLQPAAVAAANATWQSHGQSSPLIAGHVGLGSVGALSPVSAANNNTMLAAMSPVAAAAAIAAAAALTAATEQGSSPPQAAQTVLAVAAAAAAAGAAAAAAAAVVGISSPAAWQQQQQATPPGACQLGGTDFSAIPGKGLASEPPTAHVVRSLFGERQSPSVAAHALSGFTGPGVHSPNSCTSRRAVRYPQQEQVHAGPAALQQQQQCWQQQRPLPWLQLPTLDNKPHLSPMKAYLHSSGTDEHSRLLGHPEVIGKKPLGEATNSPGVVKARASSARASTAGMQAAAAVQQERRTVTSRLEQHQQQVAPGGAGVTGAAPAERAVLTAETADGAAHTAAADTDISAGNEGAEGPPVLAVAAAAGSSSTFMTPTKQRIRHRTTAPLPGYTQGNIGLTNTATATAAAAAAADGERVVLGAAGLSAVSGAVTLGSPALQRLWSGYKTTWMPARSPPAHTSGLCSITAVGAEADTAEQLPAAVTTAAATESTAALAGTWPVRIDARFYPPSARKLFEGYKRQNEAATAAAEVAGAPARQSGANAATTAPAPAQQHQQHSELLQLQQLLEQQLLEMDLLGKDAAEAATAMAGSRTAAAMATPAVAAAAVGVMQGGVAGDVALQQGYDGDVDTDSPEAQQRGAHLSSVHDNSEYTTDSDAADTDSRASNIGRSGYRALGYEHPQLRESRVRGANRMERLVIMYRQQQAMQQAPQPNSKGSRGPHVGAGVVPEESAHGIQFGQHGKQDWNHTDDGNTGISEMIKRFLED